MSKELKALQDLSKLVFIHGGVEQYKIIEKALRALEIIKEKVNLRVKESKDKEIHILVIENIFNVPISEETYDLLKEVLL